MTSWGQWWNLPNGPAETVTIKGAIVPRTVARDAVNRGGGKHCAISENFAQVPINSPQIVGIKTLDLTSRFFSTQFQLNKNIDDFDFFYRGINGQIQNNSI